MDYIENTLGLKVYYQPWKYTNNLPYHLLDRYDFQQATLDSVKTLFLYPKTELDQLASVKKQIIKIQFWSLFTLNSYFLVFTGF